MNSDQKIPEGLPARLTEKYLRINALYEHKKSPRDRYVNGIMQLSEFRKSRDHFMKLLFSNKKADIEDMLYIVNNPLEKNLEHNDKALFSFLTKTIDAFKKSGYHDLDYLKVIKAIADKNNKKLSAKVKPNNINI